MLKEHGEYSFEWQGDLLILSLSGSFNDVAIERFFDQVLESFISREERPWALLSSIDGGMMGTPEVLDVIKGAYRWGEANQCKAAAISGANMVIDRIYRTFFESISYPTELFPEKDQAIEWLTSQLS